jgi:SAM-dependent methyltransferase
MKLQKINSTIITLVERITNRRIVILPRNHSELILDTTQSGSLLPMRYTYRSSSEGEFSYEFLSSGFNLHYVLYTMEFSGREPIIGQTCVSLNILEVKRGDVLRVNPLSEEVTYNENVVVTNIQVHQESRKYIARIELWRDGNTLTRHCTHYLPYTNKVIGKDYYFGDDYTDYLLHTNVDYALNMVTRYCNRVRLLDVGCALGIYTQAFLNAGFDAYGVDISEFAVQEAGKRNSPERIKCCNLDKNELPFDLGFDAIWMWDVLEHSSDPRKMLANVSKKSLPGAYLFLHTSNSDSLTKRIFASDWEGYTDYSHYGIDQVSTNSLPIWLKDLGWEILDYDCSGIWVFGNDPTVLRLQEAFLKIPELSVLLSERDLGDGIEVVARKL